MKTEEEVELEDKTKERSGINEKFIINLQGKRFVTYEGLLDYAHQLGLVSIEVEIVQTPSKDNNMTAICLATARTRDQTFTDIGDAAPNSVTNMLVPHLIRMASTRAKARALRDLTNIGMTAFEELNVMEQNTSFNYDIEPPTDRQLEKLRELSRTLNYPINYEELNKTAAINLISKLINMSNKR